MSANYREWIANLSDEEFKQWQKENNSRGFTADHFDLIENSIANRLDSIHQDPSGKFSITMGSCIENLGRMMQEPDYLPVFSMSIGHERKQEIMNLIESIIGDIHGGGEWYQSELKRRSAEEK